MIMSYSSKRNQVENEDDREIPIGCETCVPGLALSTNSVRSRFKRDRWVLLSRDTSLISNKKTIQIKHFKTTHFLDASNISCYHHSLMNDLCQHYHNVTHTTISYSERYRNRAMNSSRFVLDAILQINKWLFFL